MDRETLGLVAMFILFGGFAIAWLVAMWFNDRQEKREHEQAMARIKAGR